MIDYKRLKEIVFLLWDNDIDFSDDDTQTRIGSSFQNKHRVYNEEGFHLKDVLEQYKDTPNQELIFFIHLDHNTDARGYHSFYKNSDTLLNFPNLNYYFISRVSKKEIYNNNDLGITVYDWEKVYDEVGIDRTFIPQTISQMKQKPDKSVNSNNKATSRRPLLKYAIFTALYEEFKEIDELFDWDEKLQEKTGTITYKIGNLKGTDKYAVACFAAKTGMIEAAVICTEMIYRFDPEYILMPGVCGGSDKTEYGDIILANKVFLLGKGKITDVKENVEGDVKKAALHYNGEPLNLDQITDSNGKHIRVVAEVLENDMDSIEINEGLLQDLTPNLQAIENKINIPRRGPKEKITIRFDPMACSLSVIDKEDYFEYEIKGKDRKTKAVEMESYGVARAAQKAKGGQTKFLIFKSVMDKTDLKTDDYKELAAYTSAQFLKHLLEDNII